MRHRHLPKLARVPLLAIALLLTFGVLGLHPDSTSAATRYTFEDGTLQGWSKTGSVSALANSTDHARTGSHALKVSLTNTSYSSAGFVRVNPGSTVGRGETIEAFVYASASGPTAALFVQDQSYRQTTGSSVSLAVGWTRVSYLVPSTATLPLRQVGVQFGGNSASSATLYLDEVGTVGSATAPTSTPTKTAIPAPTSTPVKTVTVAPTSTAAPTSTPGATKTSTPGPTSTPRPTNTPTTPPPPPPSGSVSSMIWGTNFDWRIQSSPALASSLHVRSVRIAGDNANWQTYLQVAKAQGWTPLIILRNCGISDLNSRITTDKALVQQAVSIWGSSSGLYFELGNENDLQCGWNADTYTTSWNSVIPQVKPLAPSAKFGGPTNYQSSPVYISTFVKNANPKPDFVSWHEYTCDSSESASACLADVPRIKDHVLAIASAIKANGNTVPPMAITEWNYAPDGNVSSDPKATDYNFLYTWTKTAFDTFVDPAVSQYVFMTDHFNVTDNTPLFRGSTVTGQGKDFSDEYNQHARP